jgi:acyl-CoA thioesterase
MDDPVISSIKKQVEKESFAMKMGLRLVEIGLGRAVVEMAPQEDNANIFGMTHGGAIFSLIDEAFQISCNAHGTVAVALSMTVTYHRAPEKGRRNLWKFTDPERPRLMKSRSKMNRRP